MDILNTCDEIFGRGRYKLEKIERCNNLIIQAYCTVKEIYESTGKWVDYHVFDDTEAQGTFTFYTTDKPYFLIQAYCSNSAALGLFDIQFHVQNKKTKLLWKKLYVLLSQRYKPFTYYDSFCDKIRENYIWQDQQ